MRFASRVEHLGGGSVRAWDIHNAGKEAQARGEDVIVLSVGDPDFSTPSAIIDTAINALRAGDTHYTTVAGKLSLRKAVAEHQNRRTGLSLDEDNILIVAGTQNGLFAACQCLFGAGDEVIVLEPAYLTYEATIGSTGATMVRAAASADGLFRPDIEALAKAVTPKTRGILMANPCNPTGVVFTPAELEGIAVIARRHDLWVVSDEVYAELVFDGHFKAFASLPGMAERTVTVASLSKSHAMTGWRIGWIIAPKELITHADHLALCSLYGIAGFIQEAALTAIAETDAVAKEMREIYERRCRVLCDGLAGAPGITCLRPASGMFALLDVRETGLTAHEFAWGLFKAEGVSVLDASAFGPSADGYVRVAFTVGEDDLAEAARRISRYAISLTGQA
jgi:aspartate/methionine/tyrosine aminotransferase